MKALVTVLVSIFASAALACPETQLKCQLQLSKRDGTWKDVGSASSNYTTSHLQCMARLTIPSQIDDEIKYYAVSSTDGTIGMITYVNGVADRDTAIFDSGIGKELVVTRGKEKFTCTIQ